MSYAHNYPYLWLKKITGIFNASGQTNGMFHVVGELQNEFHVVNDALQPKGPRLPFEGTISANYTKTENGFGEITLNPRGKCNLIFEHFQIIGTFHTKFQNMLHSGEGQIIFNKPTRVHVQKPSNHKIEIIMEI